MSKNKSNPLVEKVTTVGIVREANWLYFIDKQGDVSRVPMTRGRMPKKRRVE